MPEIPKFIIERDAPGPGSISTPKIRQEPRTITAAGAVGRAISEFGEAGASFTTELAERRRELAAKEAKALETSIGLEAIFNSKLELAGKAQEFATQDPINADKNFKKFFKDFSGKLTKNLKGLSVESQNVVFKNVGDDALGHLVNLRSVKTKAVVDRNLQVLNKAEEIQLGRYIKSGDPQERERIIDETRRLFKTSEFTGVSSPQAVKDRSGLFVQNAEFERASADLNRDPGTFLTRDLRKEYPLIADAEKYNSLADRADKEFRGREKRLEEQSKAVRLALVGALETRAVQGILDDRELDGHVARNDLDPEDAKKLRDLREGARIRRDTNPVVVAEFQREILENPSQEVKTRILHNRNMAIEARLELAGQVNKILAAKADPGHFSNTPEFEFAVKDIARSLTGGGLLAGLFPEEGQKVSFALRELWARVGKGEDPIKIAPGIVEKHKKKPSPKIVGRPRFETKEDLAKALENKTITDQEFLEEINRLRSLDGGETE